jgi:hypothetical protein
LVMGYPAAELSPATKKSLEQIVFYNAWQA